MNKKTILVLFGLFGLIGWAIYDNFFSEQVSNSDVQVEQETEETDIKEETGLAAGNKAPDFQLQTFNGEAMSLSDLRGKKVILNFWASWCPPCKAEMPHMQNFYTKNQNQNIELLAVNMTTAEKNQGDISVFIEDYGLTFPVVLDVKGDVSSLYQAISIPTTYFINSDGSVHYKVIGPVDEEMLEELVGDMN